MKKHSSVLKFVLMVIICGILGGLAAAFLGSVDASSLGLALSQWLIMASPLLLALSVVLCLLGTVFFYIRAKNRLNQNDYLNDDLAFDQIDHNLTISMTINSLIYVLAFLFFGIFAAGLDTLFNVDMPLGYFIITIGIFIIGAFVGIYLQTCLIKMTKVLYPNKKGDPLEFSFAKDWLDSCDEAEQYIIYRSAYKAYQITQKCLIFGWLIAVFGAMFFSTGLLPIVLVTLIWGVITLTFSFQSMKLSKTQLR